MMQTESNEVNSSTRNPYVKEEPVIGESSVTQNPVEAPPAYEDVREAFKPEDANSPPLPQVTVVTVAPTKFGDVPVHCICPNCHQSIVTTVEHKSGWLVWLICLVLILLGFWLGCCLIPFCIDDLKDKMHYCPNCHALVGKRKRL